MKTHLIHFEATDHLGLAGLLFEPDRRTRDVAVFLHGNGDSSIFYSGRTNALAEEITRRGVAYFPFNNRGAYMIKRLRRSGRKPKSFLYGMSHERIRECVFDIDGAIRFLKKAGYRRIHLVGHSTGANKICVYDYYKPRNSATSYLLLAGGDDSGLYRRQWGYAKFARVLDLCRRRIKEKRGDEFVPPNLSPFFISWKSLYDTINPDGDYNVFPFLEVMEKRVSRKPLFRHFRGVRKRTLVLYGENDEYCFDDVPRCVEILRSIRLPDKRMQYEIMPGANHGFGGYESELGAAIAQWALQ